MAEPVYDDISKIYHLLNYAEFAEAQQVIHTLSRNSLSKDDETRVRLAEALSLLHLGLTTEASEITIPLINNISSYPKSIQIQILHIAAQTSLKSNNITLTRIYLDKFIELYENVSNILKEKANPYYGNILNIQGLLLCFEGDYTQALPLFEESMLLHNKLDLPYSKGIAMFNAGKTANTLRQSKRAETLLVDTYQLFKDIGYLPGQLQAAEELIVTFDLQGDEISRDLYYNITKDLSSQVATHLIEQQNIVQIERLGEKNNLLRQQLNSSQSQLNNRDKSSSDLEDEVEYLRRKVEDFHDIKVVYDKLKEQIVQMEETIGEQNAQIINLENTILNFERQSPTESKTSETDSEVIVEQVRHFTEQELEDLLASDKLIDSIYVKLVEITSAKIRILAMQLRASSQNCVAAIRKLQEHGIVNVDSWNFSNPTVSLMPHN